MFSQACVCPQGVRRGLHTHRQTWTWIPYPLLLTSGGHHRKFVRSCSLEDLPPPPTETRTVGKWMVRILLKSYFFVLFSFCFNDALSNILVTFCLSAKWSFTVWIGKNSSCRRFNVTHIGLQILTFPKVFQLPFHHQLLRKGFLSVVQYVCPTDIIRSKFDR